MNKNIVALTKILSLTKLNYLPLLLLLILGVACAGSSGAKQSGGGAQGATCSSTNTCQTGLTCSASGICISPSIACGQNMQANPDTTSTTLCICIAGYQSDGNGGCTICPTNSSSNGAGDACALCTGGQTSVSGGQCSGGSPQTPTGATCISNNAASVSANCTGASAGGTFCSTAGNCTVSCPTANGYDTTYTCCPTNQKSDGTTACAPIPATGPTCSVDANGTATGCNPAYPDCPAAPGSSGTCQVVCPNTFSTFTNTSGACCAKGVVVSASTGLCCAPGQIPSSTGACETPPPCTASPNSCVTTNGAGYACTATGCIACPTGISSPNVSTDGTKCVQCNVGTDCQSTSTGLSFGANATCTANTCGCIAPQVINSHTNNGCVACNSASDCPANNSCTNNTCVPNIPSQIADNGTISLLGSSTNNSSGCSSSQVIVALITRTQSATDTNQNATNFLSQVTGVCGKISDVIAQKTLGSSSGTTLIYADPGYAIVGWSSTSCAACGDNGVSAFGYCTSSGSQTLVDINTITEAPINADGSLGAAKTVLPSATGSAGSCSSKTNQNYVSCSNGVLANTFYDTNNVTVLGFGCGGNHKWWNACGWQDPAGSGISAVSGSCKTIGFPPPPSCLTSGGCMQQ